MSPNILYMYVGMFNVSSQVNYLRVTVVPIAEEFQHLSVMIQELSQIVHLVIGPEWLHGG